MRPHAISVLLADTRGQYIKTTFLEAVVVSFFRSSDCHLPAPDDSSASFAGCGPGDGSSGLPYQTSSCEVSEVSDLSTLAFLASWRTRYQHMRAIAEMTLGHPEDGRPPQTITRNARWVLPIPAPVVSKPTRIRGEQQLCSLLTSGLKARKTVCDC